MQVARRRADPGAATVAVARDAACAVSTEAEGGMMSFAYGCMKLRVGASDAGSIPATSTTTGVHGFDGALIRDGQPAMVPAASGSPVSRGPVRWAKTKLPTTTAITSRCFALRDVPRGRGVTNAARVAPAIRGASFHAASNERSSEPGAALSAAKRRVVGVHHGKLTRDDYASSPESECR